MGRAKLTEQLDITTADGTTAHLVADATVVNYQGHLFTWHGPMVFAAICKCRHCIEKSMAAMAYGQPSPEPRLALAAYAGGPTELKHVRPFSVTVPADQETHAHLLGDEQPTPEGTA